MLVCIKSCIHVCIYYIYVYPLVNVYITNWKDPPCYQWVNPLFRLGHGFNSDLWWWEIPWKTHEMNCQGTRLWDPINGHATGTEKHWRYLAYIRPIFQAYVRGYTNKIWPYMVQYLQFRILKFPLIICPISPIYSDAACNPSCFFIFTILSYENCPCWSICSQCFREKTTKQNKKTTVDGWERRNTSW